MILTILALALIAAMALAIAKLYREKKAGDETISELRSRIASMEAGSAGSSEAGSSPVSSAPEPEAGSSPVSSAPEPEAGSSPVSSAPEPEAGSSPVSSFPEPEAETLYPSYTLDFVDLNADGSVYGADARSFGWEEWLTDGCSSWCSVDSFETVVTASSTLEPQGSYSYSPSNVQSTDRGTSWVEGVAGDGVGEYIEIEQSCLVGGEDYETDIVFRELCVVNGYAATERNWNENNRVRELKMYFNGDFVAVIVLEDTIKQQYIDISKFNLKVRNGEKASFRFEIGGVYQGTKYDDTCLTGLLIEFSGRTGH